MGRGYSAPAAAPTIEWLDIFLQLPIGPLNQPRIPRTPATPVAHSIPWAKPSQDRRVRQKCTGRQNKPKVTTEHQKLAGGQQRFSARTSRWRSSSLTMTAGRAIPAAIWAERAMTSSKCEGSPQGPMLVEPDARYDIKATAVFAALARRAPMIPRFRWGAAQPGQCIPVVSDPGA